MIKKMGVGIDVVEVNRFKMRPYKSNERFYRKLFLPSEINYCLKYKDSYLHFAGKFALKEALKKSIPDKVNILDIMTSHTHLRPTVKIIGSRKYLFIASISHENNIAIAVVLSEQVH